MAKKKQIKITLQGNPKSTSHIYKMTCRGKFGQMFMSKEGKTIKKSYQEQVRKQFKRKILNEDLKTTTTLFFQTKRKSDHDNFGKLIWDALEGIVYLNDNQIRDGRVILDYDKENPRAEIIIELLEEAKQEQIEIDRILDTFLRH